MGIGRALRVGAVGLPVLLTAACGGATSTTGGPTSRPTVAAVAGSGSTAGAVAPAVVASGRVGVLLPAADDPTAAWQAAHRSQLAVALAAVGFEAVIRNAGTAAAATAAADALIADGARVLVVAGLEPSASAAVLARARAAGVGTVAYRRFDSAADVYVGTDDEAAGRLQADGLLKCLQDKGVARPKIIVLGGPVGDPPAVLTQHGWEAVLEPKFASGELTKVGAAVTPTTADAAALFTQMLAAAGARVDGVLAADDALADAVIGVLRQNGLSVPVTGRGATVVALRNVLTGEQCMTVHDDPAADARAAATAAASLANHQDVPGATTVHDDAGGRDVPALLVAPSAVVRIGVRALVASGEVTTADLCAGLVERCAAAGIPSAG